MLIIQGVDVRVEEIRGEGGRVAARNIVMVDKMSGGAMVLPLDKASAEHVGRQLQGSALVAATPADIPGGPINGHGGPMGTL